MNRLTVLQDMETRQPDDAFVKYAIALEYISMEDDEKALQYLQLVAEKFPAYVATYLHLGKLYERLNTPLKAIETYKRGIEVATAAKDMKNLGELREALMLAEDE